MKILHIVENLDKGAVENLLVRIFAEVKKIRPHWEWTFYCILGKEGRLDNIVREAGGKIIYSPVSISKKFCFLRHLRYILKKEKYDIIHSHHDYLSGFYLWASLGISFKKRILHVHNTDKALPVGNKVLHGLLLNPFKNSAIYFSDIIVGISHDTLLEFVGTKKYNQEIYKVLYYGIDLQAFEQEVDKQLLRTELNLPSNSKVILFAGRMNFLKNPKFIIEILIFLLKTRTDIYAVFVGEGEQKDEITEKCGRLGICEHIRLLGWRNDIASIMKSSDLFIFPRIEYPKEGLGLVVIEAQAAGLPILITKGIVEDAIIIKDLAHYLTLENPVKWAEKVLQIFNNEPVIQSQDAYHIMQKSIFEMRNAANSIVALYED